jgi:2-oxoglutarate dehydrogenase E2 component (dihydrolipoamide succinyltransferase)
MSLVDLVMPKLGESIMEATILKWYKSVGDTIQLDETLLDIATDKVDSEVPSTAAGIIKEILFETNSVVPIGTVIARIQTAGSNAATPQKQMPVTPEKEVIAPIKETPIEIVTSEVPYTPTNLDLPSSLNNGEAKFFSPLVMNIAQNEGISMNELQTIQGTGSLGRVSKKDILNYLDAKKSGTIKVTQPPVSAEPIHTAPVVTSHATTKIATKPLPADIFNQAAAFQTSTSTAKFASPDEVIITGNTEIVEMDRMRKLIAKHMVDSVQTSPHVTSFVEADVTNMVVWREKVKQLFEKREGTKLTYTPMFLEVIASCLEQFPLINSSLQGDQIVYKKDINIGMATALPTGNLIVPVIKGANQLSIVGITKAVNNLANAARNNQLKPTDTKDGTFTVTNVGTFGSIMGTPIINQPQVAILALGAIKKRPVVVETPSGDAIAIRHIMYLSMSYDHRIVDGAIGTQFLAAVAKACESWDENRQWFQYV